MEQLIESQYAQKIKENINLKSHNEKLKQTLKNQKELLTQAKIQLQQSLSVLIRQSKSKNDIASSNASYEKLISNIYLKIKKLKLFQGELKSKLNESELLKKKIKKVKNIEIEKAKHDFYTSSRSLSKLSRNIELNTEILANDTSQLTMLKSQYKNKNMELRKNTFINTSYNSFSLFTTIESKRDNLSGLSLKELLKQLDYYYIQKEKYIKHKQYLTLEKDKYINSIEIQKKEIASQLDKVNIIKENYETQIKNNNTNKIELIQNLKNVLAQIVLYNNKIDKLTYDNEIKSKEYRTKEDIVNTKLNEIKDKIKEIRNLIANDNSESYNEKEVLIKLDNISKENQINAMKEQMNHMVMEYEKQIIKLNQEIKSSNIKRKGRFDIKNSRIIKTPSKNKKMKRDSSANF